MSYLSDYRYCMLVLERVPPTLPTAIELLPPDGPPFEKVNEWRREIVISCSPLLFVSEFYCTLFELRVEDVFLALPLV